MATQDILNYYADLLILQYKTQPKARETIKALVTEVYSNGLLLDLIDAFNIDTAVGKQLDILGKYIGLNRTVKDFIQSTQTIVLTDEQYRTLLKLKLVENVNFSSTAQIKQLLYDVFPNDIRLYDNRDMTFEYWLSTQFQDLIGVILAEELLPLPMGIGYKVLIIDDDILDFYGYYSANGLNNNLNGFSTCEGGFRGRFLRTDDNYLSEE